VLADVEIICGLAGTRDYYTRKAATHRLPDDLSGVDVLALQAFLNVRFDDAVGLSLLQWNAVKNDVVAALLKQKDFPQTLPIVLVSGFRDETHDPVWRDYCVQFMARSYERSDGAAASRRLLLDALWQATKEQDETFAGTALIGLERLSRYTEAVDCDAVAQTAVIVAGNSDMRGASRITALRMAAGMGARAVLPVSRALAKEADSISLQSAAIATLGDLGSSDQDITLIRDLTSYPDERISRVAIEALAEMQRR